MELSLCSAGALEHSEPRKSDILWTWCRGKGGIATKQQYDHVGFNFDHLAIKGTLSDHLIGRIVDQSPAKFGYRRTWSSISSSLSASSVTLGGSWQTRRLDTVAGRGWGISFNICREGRGGARRGEARMDGRGGSGRGGAGRGTDGRRGRSRWWFGVVRGCLGRP